jgi:hypothetical protein
MPKRTQCHIHAADVLCWVLHHDRNLHLPNLVEGLTNALPKIVDKPAARIQ